MAKQPDDKMEYIEPATLAGVIKRALNESR